MTQAACGTVRESIPDLAAQRLSNEAAALIQDHLAGCDECRAELEFARMLFAARPSAPAALATRVVRVAERDRASGSRPWWGISAAAVAALALGIGIIGSDPSTAAAPSGSGFTYEYEMEEGELWLSDDGLLAGAPALDGLSDEDLMLLLDELVTSAPGGSA